MANSRSTSCLGICRRPGTVWLVTLTSLAAALKRYRVVEHVSIISYSCAVAVHGLPLGADHLARTLADIPIDWETVGTALLVTVLGAVILWVTGQVKS